MLKLRKLLIVFSLFTMSLGLTSSMSVATLPVEGKPVATSVATNDFDLKKIAETVKGGKLSFKEKVGIKFFGKKFKKAMAKVNDGKKTKAGTNWTVALILAIFVSGLGIHRFYLGYTWQGVVQLLTAGGCGIWALIDLIRIITKSLKPKDGEYSN